MQAPQQWPPSAVVPGGSYSSRWLSQLQAPRSPHETGPQTTRELATFSGSRSLVKPQAPAGFHKPNFLAILVTVGPQAHSSFCDAKFITGLHKPKSPARPSSRPITMDRGFQGTPVPGSPHASRCQKGSLRPKILHVLHYQVDRVVTALRLASTDTGFHHPSARLAAAHTTSRLTLEASS